MPALEQIGRGSLMAVARQHIGRAICASIKEAFGVELDEKQGETVIRTIVRPRKTSGADPEEVGITANSLMRFVAKVQPRPQPNEIAEKITACLNTMFDKEGKDDVVARDLRSVADRVKITGSYLNFHLHKSFIGSIIDDIVFGDFVKPLQSTREKVMVEYSQPNTHKAFHVGHMRNVALGDSIARIYKCLGYDVVAANYFGDEGAHVAKCLWLLSKKLQEAGVEMDPSADEAVLADTVAKGLNLPNDGKGEYLGLVYAEATDLLDMEYYTRYPLEGIVGAQVLSIKPHPENDKWKIVQVKYGQREGDVATVVCGGTGYKVDDIIGYAPVGSSLKKKTGVLKIEPKDMKGVESCGMMLGFGEAGESFA